jgi:hypothetical protein
MNNLAVLFEHFSYNNYTASEPNSCYSLTQVGAGQMSTASVSELEAQICLINPLNAELNLICYLLILLEDLTIMGPCIVSIFQYISNKM